MVIERRENSHVDTSPVEGVGQAPAGTYAMLEGLLGSENARARRWGTAQHNTFILVFAERDCKETNGSCMDLYIRQRTRRKGREDSYYAHITKGDVIVSLGSRTSESGAVRQNESPKLEEVIEILHATKDRLPTKAF